MLHVCSDLSENDKCQNGGWHRLDTRLLVVNLIPPISIRLFVIISNFVFGNIDARMGLLEILGWWHAAVAGVCDESGG